MSTSKLIENLSSNISPVKPMRNHMPLWIVLLLINGIVFVSMLGLRQDFLERLADIHFWLSVGILTLSLLLTGWAAFQLAKPHINPERYFYSLFPILLLTPALGFKLFEEFHYHQHNALSIDYGISCVILTVVFAFLPFCFLVYTIRKGFTIAPTISGIIGGIAAASSGSLVLNFTCYKNSAIHHIIWHYIPIIGIGIAGYYLGIKLFSHHIESKR